MEKHGITEYTQGAKEFVSVKHPSKKFLKPQDIAGMVEFLCTDYASQIQGAAFSIDGGWTIC